MAVRQESYAGLELDVLETDRLSRRVLSVRHQGASLPDLPALQYKAERALEQLSYLEDRLRLVEQDAVREAIILRSETPQTESDGLSFLEMQLLQNGMTHLQRLRYCRNTGEREVVDMVFTERLLERFAQDLNQLSDTPNRESK
ncbi:MAG: hypothetical protein ACO1RX_05410 [Candidatus Sericytochromatia bacterium]